MSNNEALISIVLTTYNSQDTIEDVLESIITQDFDLSRVELIIVDGGSNDNTLLILSRFIEKNSNFFRRVELIVHDRNYGLSKARNDGIRMTKGRFVLILDDDVIMERHVLSTLFRYLNDAPENVCGVIPLHMHIPETKLKRWERLVRETKVTEASAVTSCALIRREVFEKVGLYDETLGLPFTMGEEIEFYARLKRLGCKVLILGFVKVLHAYDNKYWKKLKSVHNATVVNPKITRFAISDSLLSILNAVKRLGKRSYRYAYKRYVSSLPVYDKLRWYSYVAVLIYFIISLVSIVAGYAISFPFDIFQVLIPLVMFITILYVDVVREYWNTRYFYLSLILAFIALSWRILRSSMLVFPVGKRPNHVRHH